MIQHRTATLADADYFSRHMRLQDRVEIEAAFGPSGPHADIAQIATRASVMQSADARVAALDGKPFAIYGCNPKDDLKAAVVWLLGTPTLDTQRRFLVQLKGVVAQWAQRYGFLFNYVHADNEKSIRWLQHLGFTIADPIPYGVNGQLFHPFYQKPNVP